MRVVLSLALFAYFALPAIKAEFFPAVGDYFQFNTMAVSQKRELPLSMPREMAFCIKNKARHMKGSFSFNPFDERNKKFSSLTEIPWFSVIVRESRENGVDPALTLAIIQKESSFDSRAYSRSGAVGLMQVLPSTARWLGLKDTRLLWNPETNIKYGVKYIKTLAEIFSAGDISNLGKKDIRKKALREMLAAYNAGPGNVSRYGDVPPFAETRNYVYLTSMFFRQYKDLIIDASPYAWSGSLLPTEI